MTWAHPNRDNQCCEMIPDNDVQSGCWLYRCNVCGRTDFPYMSILQPHAIQCALDHDKPFEPCPWDSFKPARDVA